MLGILRNDPWLEPYAEAIEGRHEDVKKKLRQLQKAGGGKLTDFANAYKYYGLHRQQDGSWVLRELAPNATAIYLVGTFNGWQKQEQYAFHKLDGGKWEIVLPPDALHNGDLYKLLIEWPGGSGERIPAYATRVVQDENTKIFSAEVYAPETPYQFEVQDFKPDVRPLLIYECHIGMAQQEEKVGTYDEFRRLVLPRIAKDGYNAIQIMAIQEHPYYGSFGYHNEFPS